MEDTSHQGHKDTVCPGTGLGAVCHTESCFLNMLIGVLDGVDPESSTYSQDRCEERAVTHET